MRVILFFIFSLFLFCTWSKVSKLEVTGLKKIRASYKEVCQLMEKNHLVLIGAASTWQIDCMGDVVSVFDFCKRKISQKRIFLRGYVNQKDNEVICETGKTVYLSLACDKRHKGLCVKPLESCRKLNQIYAQELELVHHSLIPKDIDDALNCYYARPYQLPISRHDSFWTEDRFEFLKDSLSTRQFSKN